MSKKLIDYEAPPSPEPLRRSTRDLLLALLISLLALLVLLPVIAIFLNRSR